MKYSYQQAWGCLTTAYNVLVIKGLVSVLSFFSVNSRTATSNRLSWPPYIMTLSFSSHFLWLPFRWTPYLSSAEQVSVVFILERDNHWSHTLLCQLLYYCIIRCNSLINFFLSLAWDNIHQSRTLQKWNLQVYSYSTGWVSKKPWIKSLTLWYFLFNIFFIYLSSQFWLYIQRVLCFYTSNYTEAAIDQLWYIRFHTWLH